MGDLLVRIVNVKGEPLDDVCDVRIVDASSGSTLFDKRKINGKKAIKVSGLSGGVRQAIALPTRYRSVSKLVSVPTDGRTTVVLPCPVDPKRVTQPLFPSFQQLPSSLQLVLERSTLEGTTAGAATPGGPTPGQQLYDGLDNHQKAGLLNIFTKMTNVAVNGTNAWAHVDDLYRIRGDRIFANVQVTFRDGVKTAVSAGFLEGVSGALHTPPPGFESANSFKTRDSFGNLQLSFFSSVTSPLRFRVDADIDDAAGIGHAFQVIDHLVTNSDTHPYDIHQILTFHQGMEPPYALLV